MCLHDEGLAARWNWVSKDGDSAAGWIACRKCGEALQRLSYAGGGFRGQGWYLGAFLQQLAAGPRLEGFDVGGGGS